MLIWSGYPFLNNNAVAELHMDLLVRLNNVCETYQEANRSPERSFSASVSTPWDLCIRITIPYGGHVTIRNLRDGDAPLLAAFREELSPESRDLFCPYPWDRPAELERAFNAAIASATARTDFSCVMLAGTRPVGHFFLWKAGHNPHSAEHGLEIPELGVAIADVVHHRGLGLLAVRIMLAVAEHLRRDAVELTTALHNHGGWNTYRNVGFEHVGNIQNPLEVDATEVAAGIATASRFREERQMVYVINRAATDRILTYLATKRGLRS